MKGKDRILLVMSSILSIYSSAEGFFKFSKPANYYVGLAFAVVLIVFIALFLKGKDIFWNKWFVLFSSLFPLLLSIGLVVEFFPSKRTLFILYGIFGLLFMWMAHTYSKDWGSFAAALVHGGAGMTVFILPVVAVGRKMVHQGFQWFSLGAFILAAMGGELLYYFSKEQVQDKQIFLDLVPVLLFLSSIFFALGIFFL